MINPLRITSDEELVALAQRLAPELPFGPLLRADRGEAIRRLYAAAGATWPGPLVDDNTALRLLDESVSDDGGGGVPEWLAELDFENGVYEMSGSSVALSSLISDPSKVADGALVQLPHDDIITFLGDLADLANTNDYVVVIEYEIDPPDFSSDSYLFATNNADESNEFVVYSYNSALEYVSSPSGSRTVPLGGGVPDPGRYKTAVLHTPSLLAGSLNGGAAVSDVATMSALETTLAILGGYVGSDADGTKIYSIKFKSADGVTDADLPALSAVSESEIAAYTASSVHFVDNGALDFALLSQANSSIPNNSKITLSQWFKGYWNAGSAFPYIFRAIAGFYLEIGGNYDTDAYVSISTGDGQISFGSDDGLFVPETWNHVAVSVDVGHPFGSKVVQLYVNGVSVLNPVNTVEVGDSLTIPWNNNTINFVRSLTQSPSTFDHCDLQVWIGQQVDLSDPANLSKLISGGKPVDPAVASAAFGAPTILFSGDSTTYPANQGSGGAFTLTGTLTNSSTSPSDA